MNKKKGRPPKPKYIDKLDFSTFLEDITLFRNYLMDITEPNTDMFNEEDEDPNAPIIRKFLLMETWKLNIFIVYILNKDKRLTYNGFTFKALADLLKMERGELMAVIKDIKTELHIL